MASPLKTGKQAVDLAAGSVRVSKIRRDPPPVKKEVTIADRDERDRRYAIIGILTFTLAIVIALIGLGDWMGWSPSQYTVQVGEPRNADRN